MSLKAQMPKVAEMVAGMRRDMGDAWVDACIKAGMAGKPDQFFAVEGGHIVGTPFTLGSALAENMRVCFIVGGAGAVIRTKGA